MFPMLSSKLSSTLSSASIPRTVLFCLLAIFGLSAIPRTAHASTASTTTLTITASTQNVTLVAPQTIITLIASVAVGGSSVHLGQVTFCDATVPFCTDIHALGTAQLTLNGTATLRFVASLGNHSYKAVFLGTHNFSSSTSSPQSLAVTTGALASTTTITSTGGPGDYTLTATVTGTGTAPPTGNVSFLDTDNANYVLGKADLSVGAYGLSLLNKSTAPTTGSGSDSIVTADFNGDGIPDVASTSLSSGITIFLGNGDGTLTQIATGLLSSSSVGCITSADFNGDGIPDLAIGALPNDHVRILLGNGNGTFIVGPVLARDTDVIAMLAPVDLNGDGIEDLVGVDAGNNFVFILLGRGDGEFTEVTPHPATGQNPVIVAIGDYNGDGKPDLAIDNVFGPNRTLAPASLTILLGNGDGTFSSGTPVPVGIGPEGLVTADFNGDGKLDLAVSNIQSPATLEVLLGKGDGTFAAPVTNLRIDYLNTLAFGDFNGDKIPDIAAFEEVGTTAPQNVIVLIGNGDGTFNPVTGSDLAVPAEGAVADFNRDGLDDIAIANETTGITIMLSQLSSSATATVTSISPVGTGTHYIDASYPGDGSNLASLSTAIPLTAERVPTALSLGTNPSTTLTAGQPVILKSALTPHNAQNHEATGSVSFSNNGAALGNNAIASGTAALTTSALTAGADDLLAQYPGDTNFEPSSATLAASAASNTDLTLASSLNPAPALTPITFTAQLPANSGGTIVFSINGQTINTTPNGAGTATTTISTLTQGTYPVTASWFATGHALASQASLTQIITPPVAAPDFSITGPSSISFVTHYSGSSTLMLLSLNGFAANVSITCNPPLPINYSCTLKPSSVILAANSYALTTFSLQQDYSATNRPSSRHRIVLASLLPLTLLSLASLARRRRTILRTLLAFTFLVTFTTSLTACGPDHAIPATPPGTYPVSFTATGTNLGSSTPTVHTTIVDVIIKP